MIEQAKNLDLLVPVPLVGAAIGTFAASFAMKKFGRKRTLIASYVFLCIPGSFLQLFAPDMAAMVVGRFWNCKILISVASRLAVGLCCQAVRRCFAEENLLTCPAFQTSASVS